MAQLPQPVHPTRMDLAETTPDGRLRLHFHPGQWRAWQSSARFVLVLAGTQGGKTAFGPHWLLREIQTCGPGDYLVIAPTYPLLAKKALPEFLRLFETWLSLGTYHHQDRVFRFSSPGAKRIHGDSHNRRQPTKVYFGHAQDPESLEAATGKAAWLDEAGQRKFRLGSWEAVQRRLAIHQGRILITTTPYDLGWLKQQLYDPWKSARQAAGSHPLIEVVCFDSTENPAFPREEFQRARDSLPRWKFDLFYRARFTRPAGLIYDCFDPARHVVPRFRIPQEWPRYLGMDFGATNTAALFAAQELADGKPTGRLYYYREYHPGKRTPAEHVQALLEHEPRLPIACGGAASEDEWRLEFARAGLPILAPPVRDVEVGIDLVYAAHRRQEILVFQDLNHYLEQKQSYSRVVNDAGEVQQEIEDKSAYHLLDAERYLISHLRHGRKLTLWA